MLKKLELYDAYHLHEHLVDPSVYPYVRYKAMNMEEYLFVTKQVIEKEQRGEVIMRVILDEQAHPIGQIALYDMIGNSGFLGTWLGAPYHGKGYNRVAKETFFAELFYELGMESIFMKIRTTNEKSKRAALKLPYVEDITHSNTLVAKLVNTTDVQYDVFEIRKDVYELFYPNTMEA